VTEIWLRRGQLSEARRAAQNLPTGTFPRRVMQVWLGAWIRCLAGDSLGASRALEDSLRQLDAALPHSPRLTLPLLSAAEWRLARGEWGAADSLAKVARGYAAVDSLALTRSGLVGQAEWTIARARLGLQDSGGAWEAAQRARTALASGFGVDHPRTHAAQSLADSLSH
jgi:hypothetical protein